MWGSGLGTGPLRRTRKEAGLSAMEHRAPLPGNKWGGRRQSQPGSATRTEKGPEQKDGRGPPPPLSLRLPRAPCASVSSPAKRRLLRTSICVCAVSRNGRSRIVPFLGFSPPGGRDCPVFLLILSAVSRVWPLKPLSDRWTSEWVGGWMWMGGQTDGQAGAYGFCPLPVLPVQPLPLSSPQMPQVLGTPAASPFHSSLCLLWPMSPLSLRCDCRTASAQSRNPAAGALQVERLSRRAVFLRV